MQIPTELAQRQRTELITLCDPNNPTTDFPRCNGSAGYSLVKCIGQSCSRNI